MTTYTLNETWTAMRGKLVFDFTLYRGEEHGESAVRIYFRGDPRKQKHEIALPARLPRELNIRFPLTDEGEVYVHGTLRREADRDLGGGVQIGVLADIVYGHHLRYDEQHFEGFMVFADAHQRPPRPTPEPAPPPFPPPAPDPVPAPDDPTPFPLEPIIDATHGDLFPYIYVRQWPAVSARAMRLRFISYLPAAASPPDDTLYQAMLAARPAGRAAMQDVALRYIEGDASCTPPFLGAPSGLPLPLNHLAKVALAAQQLADQPHALRQRIHQLLQVEYDEQVTALLASPAYRATSEAAWQSYFALVAIPGYDNSLLTTLIRILSAVHLLNTLYAPASPPPDPAEAWSPELIKALANASIVLPAAIFPLPPAAASPQCTPAAGGSITPYAIGDLQMVRQRLLRYDAGEIAYIENVMRGERKEVGRKRAHRQLDYQQQHSDQAAQLDNQDSDQRASLLEAAHRAVAEKMVSHKYNDFQTSYGPPTQATLNGSWDESITQGKLPGADDITRFAREVLSQTVNRISRQVSQVRGSSTLSEHEETVVSVIDNSAHAEPVSAVFRWLNQVYEACVVNYGKRLMIEFVLPQPAAAYIAELQRLDGLNLRRPRTPDSLGLTSFRAITADNYADLAAAMQVTELEPPPVPRKYASATLRGGEEKLLAVPEGYMVAQAYVKFITLPDGATAPQVLVGRELFSATDAATASRQFGEDQSIAIAVSGGAASWSPPSDGNDVLVNVEIVCLPMPTVFDAWRIRLYQAMLNSYQRRCEQYYHRAGARTDERGAQRSPQMLRRIERRELKRACLRLLLQRAQTDGPGQPCYLQFFNDAFEWDEMSYQCYASADPAISSDDPGLTEADELFTSFLQADSTRVLLPVHPPQLIALLYYLSSGTLWEGEPGLAPVDQSDIALVDEVKRAGLPGRGCGVRVGQPWEIVVPTAMQVLDGCPLPRRHAPLPAVGASEEQQP